MEAVAAAEEQPRNTTRRLLLTAALLTVAAAIVATVSLRTHPSAARPHAAPLVTPAGLVQRSGVRVVRVAGTRAGDLRYQVLDAEKAVAVHDTARPPLLIDERTGGIVGRLYMGHSHNQPPKLGLTYYLIFENPGELLRPGGRVTVRLGDARLPHVRVQ
jgi:hypothetical protein